MLTLPQPPQSLLSSARVIIDWSEREFDSEIADAESGISSLIEWVQSYPKRASVHVVLRSGKPAGRAQSLRRSLQSLGCTVTTRVRSCTPRTIVPRGFSASEWR